MNNVIEDKNFYGFGVGVFDIREDDEERSGWQALRNSTIGGSDIPLIMGESSYGGPLEVYGRKFGLIKNTQTDGMLFGTRMKPIAKNWAMEDFYKHEGITLTIYDYPYVICDRRYEHFSANIDGIGVLNENTVSIRANEVFGIQIKTVSEFQGSKWTSGVPRDVYLQCQWYMGILEFKHFLVIALIGNKVNFRVVSRDDMEILRIRERAKDFFEENIKKRNPPNTIGLKGETENILKTQTPPVCESIKVVDNRLREFNRVDDEIKALSKKREQLKQSLYLEMGNAKEASDGEFRLRKIVSKRSSINTNILKEKYPDIYNEVIDKPKEYINARVTKV
ncbi:MAG: YqaJ viral recombinase family protein [Clostridium sp.]